MTERDGFDFNIKKVPSFKGQKKEENTFFSGKVKKLPISSP